MNLNPQQQEAVETTEGPLLVLAGAGSGKTRVIVHRIARLITEVGIPSDNILAVTFTNKAAEEMKLRIQTLVPDSVRRMWVSTFHSSCVRMLRANYDRLGLIRDFAIYDADDQKTLLKQCLAELKLDTKTFNPTAVLSRIQGAKNYLKTPDDYAEQAETFYETQVAELYKLYQRKLRENQALDFGDLLMECVFMLRNNPTVLQYYQQFFQYILIDEYQDTNAAQYHWVRLLAEKHGNLCVVGDDDQSIYRWRGADIENILRFEDDYPGAKVIKLEQNYRSTAKILEIASNVIANNSGRKEKRLWTESAAGDDATWYLAADDRAEAAYVAETIGQECQSGRSYAEMSIFYRTNAQSRLFEDELRKRQIPYVIYGGVSFYARKEIKDVLAYMRLLVNPADDVAFKRIFNTPARGLGAKAYEYIMIAAEKYEKTAVQIAQECGGFVEIPSAMQAKMKVLGSLLSRFQTLAQEVTLGNLVEAILDESGYRESLEKEQTTEAEERLENLDEFLNVVAEFERSEEEPSLTTFLERAMLVGNNDTYDPELGVVPLMTLHLAKGLEYDVVFMAGMEENLFPHSRSIDDTEELEEERRLCYVGVTRARQKLYMTSAVRRRLYGGDQMNLPSRFLEEMPAELIERTGNIEAPLVASAHDSFDDDFPVDPEFSDFDQRPVDDSEASPFREGAHVQHPQFGVGMVRRCEGKGEDQKVTVSFQSGRVKKLLVRYAHLTLLTN